MTTVILDNYDSFTYNLFQLVGELSAGTEPMVFRNDEITVDQLRALQPDNIIISPGPGRPEFREYFGICRDVILELGQHTPIMGVCLGHLGIIEAFGGKTVLSPQPRHGKTSVIIHDKSSVFQGLPDEIDVMRYHSLISDRKLIPDCFRITAWTSSNLVMAVQHKTWPLVGVQFHPESIATQTGRDMVSNFLRGNCR